MSFYVIQRLSAALGGLRLMMLTFSVYLHINIFKQ